MKRKLPPRTPSELDGLQNEPTLDEELSALQGCVAALNRLTGTGGADFTIRLLAALKGMAQDEIEINPAQVDALTYVCSELVLIRNPQTKRRLLDYLLARFRPKLGTTEHFEGEPA